MADAQFIDFIEALDHAGRLALLTEEAYRLAHARALLSSAAKNAETRKADADVATTEQRVARDQAALRKDVALQLVLYLRASKAAA